MDPSEQNETVSEVVDSMPTLNYFVVWELLTYSVHFSRTQWQYEKGNQAVLLKAPQWPHSQNATPFFLQRVQTEEIERE